MSIHDKIAWAREKYGVSLSAIQMAPDWHEVHFPDGGAFRSFTAATMDTFEAWVDKLCAPSPVEPEPKPTIRRGKP